MWTTMFAEVKEGHRGLWIFSMACLVCAAAVALASLLDGRLVNGAPVWHKPLKFFISSAIYGLTFAWYLTPLRRGLSGRPRLGSALGSAVAVLLGGELLLIVIQAARGTGSHFNVATAFDAAVFAAMGTLIALLSVVHATLWLWLLRISWSDRARLSACRWGAGLTLGGLLTGTLMLGPSPEQLATLRAGGQAPAGAHAVGVKDGGPGLPFVNWSIEGGDHRVAHFVGLHAMQALPLVLLALPAAMRDEARLLAVRTTGVAYGLLTMVLVQQARAGQSLVRPGAAFALGLLIVVAGWVAAMLALRGRVRTSAPG